ncbi:MAG TPA: response regulator transcription factor [bacterium]|nr:response regulator transcription factor [bacterium]
MAIRVVITDDQTIILSGLKAILKPEPDIQVVGEAVNGHQAVERVAALRPDLVLMDMMMNGEDGATVTKIIRERFPQTAVLVLTAHADQKLFRRAAEAGASGYILKDITPHDLVAAIRAIHAGSAMISPTISKQILQYFSTAKPAADICNAARVFGLTQREVDVLAALVDGLSDKLIGRRLFLSESTVKTHLRSIYRRLRTSNRAQAVAVTVEQKLLEIAP